MHVNSAAKGYVKQTTSWYTYTYIWPLLGHLEEIPVSSRERLDIGPDPMGNDALVISEMDTLELTVEMEGEQVPVNTLVVPVALHQIPYGAFGHESVDTEESQAMAYLRKAYHETTGRPAKHGQRLLDVLLCATRGDLEKRTAEAEEALTGALKGLTEDHSWMRGEDRGWMTSIDSLYRDVERHRAATVLRACWLRRQA